MAIATAPRETIVHGDTRFFTIMAFVMSFIIVAGFSVNLAMGRSSFDVPAAYHVHALVFMGWIGLYLAQHVTASQRNWTLHAALGRLAYLWVPAMVIAGGAIMIVVARRTGGPFFFDVNEFLISNLALLLQGSCPQPRRGCSDRRCSRALLRASCQRLPGCQSR